MLQGFLALFLFFTAGIHVISTSNDIPETNIPNQHNAAGQHNQVAQEVAPAGKTYSAPPEMVIDTSKSYLAEVQTNKGNFTIELFANNAPKTVNNFVFLSKEGFYNGIVFHRIIKTFMIQTGDPTGTGRGGPGYKFEDELDSPYQYEPGIVAMASAGPNTNGSQFFICSGEDCKGLNRSPNYTIFGKVVNGMDTILNIAGTKVEKSTYGEASQPIETIVIESITIIENKVEDVSK